MSTANFAVFRGITLALAGLAGLLCVQPAAYAQNAPEMVLPRTSELAGSTATFRWSDVTNATAWWFYVGSARGRADHYNSGRMTNSGARSRNVVVTGLPVDGQAIHMRLRYLVGGRLLTLDQEFSAASGDTTGPPVTVASEPSMVLPRSPELAGATETFRWSNTPSNVTDWWLLVGSTPGARDHYFSGRVANASAQDRNFVLSGLPVDGQVVHVRLLYLAAGVLKFTDSQYTAAEGSDEPVVQTRTPTLPTIPFDYEAVRLPNHFLVDGIQGRNQSSVISNDNTPTNNPVTNEKTTLGRVLFYDTILSANNTTSCASCHTQQFGFTDRRTLSRGFEGDFTRRHSMGLSNARFYETGKFFWDERAATLEQQVLRPIVDPVEMGMTISGAIDAVRSQPYYAALFDDAFGNDTVTAGRISVALAQFVRSLSSFNARYDRGRAQVASANQDFPNFTRQENAGKDLFFRRRDGRVSCAQCHVSEAMIGPGTGGNQNVRTTATNNGLDRISTTDRGVAEATGNAADTGKFKVPSLRNIAVSQPFMHDGRFSTIEEVIDHYSTGIQSHAQLDASLRNANGTAFQFNFSAQEKADLAAFMRTLTDFDLLSDEKFSDPF